jgi:hypothetical protein
VTARARRGHPPPRRRLAACAIAPALGILQSAMTGMNYIECDVPDGMVLAEWRRARARRKHRRRMPRLRLRLA